MTPQPHQLGVLCVDDNLHVAAALRLKLLSDQSFEWKGWLTTADDLVATVEREHPQIVLLDLDLPGVDPLQAAAELTQRCPDVRVVVFSGLVRPDLIEQALDAGVWGYVSKNDGESELITAMRKVGGGHVALSTEAAALYYGP